MPHDLEGKIVNVGDTVSIRAIVTHLYEGAENCNLTVQTELPMYPSGIPVTIALNTKQVNVVAWGAKHET